MERERAEESSTAEIVERMTSRVANSLVIAAGVIAIGIYAAGGVSQPARYQAVSTPDGRVVRVNTESGSIVSCDASRCTLIQLRSDDLNRRDEEEQERRSEQQPALPSPAAAPAASGPASSPAPATQQAPAPQQAPASQPPPAVGPAPAAQQAPSLPPQR